MRFVHTADWQIGKPFAAIRDTQKRSLVQRARIEAIMRIGTLAKDTSAEFVLVAGDLFDSPFADNATVSDACSAIGQMDLPVIAIPGNHDHGGPGSVWKQDFFLREQAALAPNLEVLHERVPFETESAYILPCPLARRSLPTDPTEWLRVSDTYSGLSQGKPRVVVAHGSTQSFLGQWDDDEEGNSFANLIDLGRLPDGEIDYVALGDWHGTKLVSNKAWFSGTPETDRFPKGGDHDPGNILVVEVERGGAPKVTKSATATLVWNELTFNFSDDTEMGEFQVRLAALLGQRVNEDLLRLELTGAIGIEASNELDRLLESLDARLLRLRLHNSMVVAPTVEETQVLAQRGSDPLIAHVARQLVLQSEGDQEAAQIARSALRELYLACMQETIS